MKVSPAKSNLYSISAPPKYFTALSPSAILAFETLEPECAGTCTSVAVSPLLTVNAISVANAMVRINEPFTVTVSPETE